MTIRTNQIQPLSTLVVYESGVGATDEDHVVSRINVTDEVAKVTPYPDVLTAQINGITDVFTTTNDYKSGTLDVFHNGRRVTPEEITELGDDSFQLSFIPVVPDFLYARYSPKATVTPGDPNQMETAVLRVSRGKSILKLEYSMVLLLTDDEEVSLDLPPDWEIPNGAYFKALKSGLYNGQINAGRGTTIDGTSAATLTDLIPGAEFIYVSTLKRWVMLTPDVTYFYDLDLVIAATEAPPQLVLSGPVDSDAAGFDDAVMAATEAPPQLVVDGPTDTEYTHVLDELQVYDGTEGAPVPVFTVGNRIGIYSSGGTRKGEGYVYSYRAVTPQLKVAYDTTKGSVVATDRIYDTWDNSGNYLIVSSYDHELATPTHSSPVISMIEEV